MVSRMKYTHVCRKRCMKVTLHKYSIPVHVSFIGTVNTYKIDKIAVMSETSRTITLSC